MKTVLITGIGRGIGRALAQKFLAEGWTVIGTTLSGQADIAHEQLSVLELDLSKSASVAACENALHEEGKLIDLCINNAGILLDEEETTLLPDKLRDTLEVNVIGTADLTERLLRDMVPHGHIIFVSSTAGSLELAGQLKSHYPMHYPAYKISKAALNMYMRTLATRLGERMIVSSVHPGWVRTAMGGEEADMPPEESAEDIYQFALTSPETGGFWFKGKRLPW